MPSTSAATLEFGVDRILDGLARYAES